FQDKKDHPYTSAEGLGICDIIVESQAHFKPLGVLGKEVCKNDISTYLYRFNDLLDKYHSLKNISIFHNHRREAGATISHSHSQIFATPFTPIYIKNEESQAEKYFVDIAPERSKKCPFCAMIAKETESFVFSIDAKFENDLKKSKLSKELKDEFKTKGFPLSKSENATVTKKNDDEWEWVIIDGEKIYIVKSEERKLNFYIYQDSGRVIRENASFIAIAPFASGSPFEIWILPKKHTPSFGNVSKRNPTVNDARFDGISEDEIGELADILTWTLGRLYICVDDPGYNFVISTPPLHFRPDEHRYWHWHIRIETQGLVIPAGYEMASQVRINPLPPENAAKFLRNNDLGTLFKPGAGSIFQRKTEDVENVLSIIRREVDENTLNLSIEQQNILKIAAGAFMFSEYYIKRKDLYDQNELTEEEKTILERAISWASQLNKYDRSSREEP
ncbi:MAG: hypothetical protein U9Q67_03125, partial [Patescibacteria group bacterium]|nr:hypothetical protein [Patescibacteria group bacterium]